jgi:hypothetical protein
MIQRMKLHMPTVSNRSRAAIGAGTAAFIGCGNSFPSLSCGSIIRISQGR